MAKALFHKNQRVYVKPVGTWALIERVVGEMLAYVADSKPVDSTRPVRYPGARVLECRAEHLANGIPVDATVWAKIQAL